MIVSVSHAWTLRWLPPQAHPLRRRGRDGPDDLRRRLLVRVSEDSREGKADARLSTGLETTRGIYEEALDQAPREAQRIAEAAGPVDGRARRSDLPDAGSDGGANVSLPADEDGESEYRAAALALKGGCKNRVEGTDGIETDAQGNQPTRRS